MRSRAASSIGRAMVRRFMIVAALISPLVISLPDAIAQNAAIPIEQTYDIPSQALNQALATFATKARISVVYETGQTVRLRSARVLGRYVPASALRVLLAGTGLAARFTGSRSAIVYVAGALPPTAARPDGPPSMALDMAEIRAPTMIGRAEDRSFVDYAHRTQTELRTILAADPDYRGRSFRVRIAIVIDRAGEIGHVTLITWNDRGHRDEHLPEILTGRRLSMPPPDGIRQPLRFDISADHIADQG